MYTGRENASGPRDSLPGRNGPVDAAVSHICQNRADTSYFLRAVPKSATGAAFIKESRMELMKANQLHREIRGMGTRGSVYTNCELP